MVRQELEAYRAVESDGRIRHWGIFLRWDVGSAWSRWRMGRPITMLSPTGTARSRGHETPLLRRDGLPLHRPRRPPSTDSREVTPGVVLDFDAAGALVGIDIDHASRKMDLSALDRGSIPVELVGTRSN